MQVQIRYDKTIRHDKTLDWTWHKVVFESVGNENIKHLCQCEPLEEHANTV